MKEKLNLLLVFIVFVLPKLSVYLGCINVALVLARTMHADRIVPVNLEIVANVFVCPVSDVSDCCVYTEELDQAI